MGRVSRSRSGQFDQRRQGRPGGFKNLIESRAEVCSNFLLVIRGRKALLILFLIILTVTFRRTILVFW